MNHICANDEYRSQVRADIFKVTARERIQYLSNTACLKQLWTTECNKQLLHCYTYRCPRVAKKLHNLFVIKDINFFFFLDDSYASTAYSENIAVYIQESQYYKNTKVMFF
jgi:hypothetical protein